MGIVFLYLFVLSLGSMAGMLCYDALFVYSFRRRKRFWLRASVLLAVFVAVYALADLLLAYLMIYESSTGVYALEWMRIGLSLIAFVMNILFILTLFGEKAIWALYASIAATAAHTVAETLYSLMLTAFGAYSVYVGLLGDPVDFWSVFFLAVSHAVCLVGTYLLFGRPFAHSDRQSDRTLNRYIAVLFAIVLAFVLGLQGSNIISGSGNDTIIVLYDVFVILFCVTMLCVQRFLLYWVKEQQERIADEQFHEAYRKQTEALQENMQAVNIKCHDLKHQIGELLSARDLDEEFLREVQDSISIYDTRISTGNERLDVILTEKSLRCAARGIDMTAMVDGGKLSFMSDSDLNSFFGNALDNAIEHLAQEPEGKRFIRISTREEKCFLVVLVENSYSDAGKMRFDRDGFPVTTKEDASAHGFGVRSMKATAEKYGGHLSYKAEGGLFILEALFLLNG